MPTTTASMALEIPSIGDSDYPTSIATSLNTIDTHTHASGSGVQIPTGGIANLAVTTGKLADGAVTQAKRAALGQQISNSSASFTTSAAGPTDVTNLSVTITTTGRPVYLSLVADPSGGPFAPSYISATCPTADVAAITVHLYEDATEISVQEIFTQGDPSATVASIFFPVSSVSHIYVPAAGTYTYKVAVSNLSANTTTGVIYAKLVAYEL